MTDIFGREMEKGDLILEAYNSKLQAFIIRKMNPYSIHYLGLYVQNIDDLKNSIKRRTPYFNVNESSSKRFIKIDKDLLPEDQRKIYEDLLKLI